MNKVFVLLKKKKKIIIIIIIIIITVVVGGGGVIFYVQLINKNLSNVCVTLQYYFLILCVCLNINKKKTFLWCKSI